MTSGERKIDGKTFRLHSRHKKKSDASKVKKRFRTDSYCRIIKYLDKSLKRKYAVYLRKKR